MIRVDGSDLWPDEARECREALSLAQQRYPREWMELRADQAGWMTTQSDLFDRWAQAHRGLMTRRAARSRRLTES